jgi:PAS domain S-box-containing protein
MNGPRLHDELDAYAVELEMQNEALRESRLELEASRAEYRELFDFAPVAYLVLGPESRIVAANVAAGELLETKREDLIGTRLSRFIAESDLEAFELHRREVCGSQGRIRARFSMMRRGGDPRVVVFESICTNPVVGEWRTALMDATETDDLRRQLEQSERLGALGAHVGGVVHDIRNMVMTMSTAADVSLKLLEENSRARRPLEQLRQAAENAGFVLTHVLKFAQDELGEPGTFDINKCIRSMQPSLSSRLGDDVDLVVALEATDAAVRASSGEIDQMLFNLTANAAHAMPSGGTIAVETANQTFAEEDADRPPDLPAGRYVVLSVRDTGAGMDPETSARAFEPFFTTKPSGRGSGLGLALVQGAARRAGGCAKLSSERGEGTTVRVYFPRASGFSRS